MQKQNTTTPPIQKRRGRPPVNNPLSPWCVRCRAHMKQRPGPKGKRWACTICQRSIYQHTVGEPSGGGPWGKAIPLSHPHCIQCRKPMAKHSKGIWRCKPCGVYPQAKRILTLSPRERTASGRLKTSAGNMKKKVHSKRYVLKMDFPQCVKCRWQMKQCGNAAKRRWECNLCGASCFKFQTKDRRTQVAKIDGNDLIAFIDSKLTNYSVEMREELRGEIAIALLTQAQIGGLRLTRASLTPATIRLIAKPIYKMQPNRFRDISLDHTYGESGQRLEERLVG